MITYDSTLKNTPPVATPTSFPAMTALATKSPYAGNQNQQDVLRSLATNAASNLDMSAYRANTDYALAQQQARNQLALSGLQNMYEAQQNERNLGMQSLRNMTGFANDLLSGLFS